MESDLFHWKDLHRLRWLADTGIRCPDVHGLTAGRSRRSASASRADRRPAALPATLRPRWSAGTLPAGRNRLTRQAGSIMSTFEHIIVERKGAVGIVRLNRPKMLNALSFGVFKEIAAAIDDLEADDGIGCIVVTGSEKAFAAGADIKEMQPKGFIDMFSEDFAAIGGDRIARCRKPTIAAVAGYALGGGCELAMMCDIVIASDTAKFGQPEITLGTIPGIGGP